MCSGKNSERKLNFCYSTFKNHNSEFPKVRAFYIRVNDMNELRVEFQQSAACDTAENFIRPDRKQVRAETYSSNFVLFVFVCTLSVHFFYFLSSCERLYTVHIFAL